jgi:hypothetical protein
MLHSEDIGKLWLSSGATPITSSLLRRLSTNLHHNHGLTARQRAEDKRPSVGKEQGGGMVVMPATWQKADDPGRMASKS